MHYSVDKGLLLKWMISTYQMTAMGIWYTRTRTCSKPILEHLKTGIVCLGPQIDLSIWSMPNIKIKGQGGQIGEQTARICVLIDFNYVQSGQF